MEISRKLERVREALDPIATQGDIARFLNNANNAQRLNDLVEDIREAVMDYQVRASKGFVPVTSNICLRHPCSGTSIRAPVR